MISRISRDFREDFSRLPKDVQQRAREAYRLFASHPEHASLKFKKLPPHADIWSVRVTGSYRAIGRWRGETILWFFIGSHSDYDKAISRL